MKKTVYIRFTIILLIVGFMLAVQYNTVQNPETRDTRDIWAIRQELIQRNRNTFRIAFGSVCVRTNNLEI